MSHKLKQSILDFEAAAEEALTDPEDTGLRHPDYVFKLGRFIGAQEAILPRSMAQPTTQIDSWIKVYAKKTFAYTIDKEGVVHLVLLLPTDQQFKGFNPRQSFTINSDFVWEADTALVKGGFCGLTLPTKGLREGFYDGPFNYLKYFNRYFDGSFAIARQTPQLPENVVEEGLPGDFY